MGTGDGDGDSARARLRRFSSSNFVRSRVSSWGGRLEGVLEAAWLEPEDWLTRYWAGEHSVLEEAYLEHADHVWEAARSVVGEVDADTVTQELFFRVVADPDFRRAFSGGDLRAFLRHVARNMARDHRRRLAREAPYEDEHAGHTPDPASSLDASLEVEAVLKELHARLPELLHPLIELRILRRLSQAEAAKELGWARTTLAYRDHKLRKTLRAIVLRRGRP